MQSNSKSIEKCRKVIDKTSLTYVTAFSPRVWITSFKTKSSKKAALDEVINQPLLWTRLLPSQLVFCGPDGLKGDRSK